jgi:hypothetical protein
LLLLLQLLRRRRRLPQTCVPQACAPQTCSSSRLTQPLLTLASRPGWQALRALRALLASPLPCRPRLL